jgi:rhomboid protease GluP
MRIDIQSGVAADAIRAPTKKVLASTSNRESVFPIAVAVLVAANVVVFLVLPIAFQGEYPTHVDRLGADWGPLTLSGQWWRLLSSMFIHIQVVHLLFNLVGLWTLGKRIERLWGPWIALLFYLSCGFIGDMTVLAYHPEVASYGASVGVLGMAGAVIAVYGMRVVQLSWKARGKLGILILYVVYIVRPEFSGGLYVGHSVGLLAGTCLALFFTGYAKTTRSRYWTFAAISLLLTIAGAVIRHHYRFG